MRLHESMAGMGTKDNDLIFLIVSRADIDLGSVAAEYHRKYNKALASDISVSSYIQRLDKHILVI